MICEYKCPEAPTVSNGRRSVQLCGLLTTVSLVYIYIYGGSRKVGTCPQEQIGPKPQVPTLISEAKVGTWSETRQRESWNLYCRERGTAITTTAPVLQRKRNYNCYDRSSIANSKKLQQSPQHGSEENCN